MTENNEVLKIKNDILEILRKNRGICLCGHSEWCELCSPSSSINSLTKAIEKYLDTIK